MNIKEKIDNYILGKLSLEEKEAFEQELKKDKELREEVELTSLIINGIQLKGESEAWDKLNSVETEEELRSILLAPSVDSIPKKTDKRRITAFVLSIAAVVVIFIYLGIQPKYSGSKLFEKYYTSQPYEAIPIRGGYNLNEDQEKLLSKAKINYKENNYKAALKSFNELMNQTSSLEIPDEVVFHAAVCQIETEDLENAQKNLESLSGKDDSEYQHNAEWLLSLVYLEKGNRKKAADILKIIINRDNEFSSKAKELLEKTDQKFLF